MPGNAERFSYASFPLELGLMAESSGQVAQMLRESNRMVFQLSRGRFPLVDSMEDSVVIQCKHHDKPGLHHQIALDSEQHHARLIGRCNLFFCRSPCKEAAKASGGRARLGGVGHLVL